MEINITQILSDIKNQNNDRTSIEVIVKEIRPKLIGNKHDNPIFSVDFLINNKQKISVVSKNDPIYEEDVNNILSLIGKKQREFNINFVHVEVKAISKIYDFNYNRKFYQALHNDVIKDDIAILIQDIDETQFKKLTLEQQQQLFISFCEYGKYPLVVKMLEHSYLANQENLLNNKSLTKKEIEDDNYFLTVAIERASYRGHLNIVKAILEYKNDISLHHAIAYASSTDRKDILDFFFYESNLVTTQDAQYILNGMSFNDKDEEIKVKGYFEKFINNKDNTIKAKI